MRGRKIMSYPIKEVYDVFRNSSPIYQEMTPEEYEEKLNFYRLQAETYSVSSGRLAREYGSYLKRWFGDGECDGYANYEMRYRLHKLPQTANGYMYE